MRLFGKIQIRIFDPKSLRSWCIKGTDESTLGKDSSVDGRSGWSWIKNADLDFLKWAHPKCFSKLKWIPRWMFKIVKLEVSFHFCHILQVAYSFKILKTLPCDVVVLFFAFFPQVHVHPTLYLVKIPLMMEVFSPFNLCLNKDLFLFRRRWLKWKKKVILGNVLEISRTTELKFIALRSTFPASLLYHNN